jgi:pyrroline-5-carboxylate reductase
MRKRSHVTMTGNGQRTRARNGNRYGILGVGEIAQAIVIGLCEDTDSPASLLLSPRSAARAIALADRFESVNVAADNQAVIDGAALVIVCLPPSVARPTLGELSFSADHVVVSVVAALPLGELRSLVAPAANVARAIPLPSVAARRGRTPIYPPNAEARALFEPLGGSFDVHGAAAFDALSAATATIAAHLSYLSAIAGWLAAKGIAVDDARDYVASIFAGVAEQLRDSSDFAKLSSAYATRGGLNERFLSLMRDSGTLDIVNRSLEQIYGALRGPAAE